MIAAGDVPVDKIDWAALSDAVVKVWKNGGWTVPFLVAWIAFWKYNPWKKVKD